MNSNSMPSIDEFVKARAIIRWTGIGIVPSEEKAQFAHGVLQDYVANADGTNDIDVKLALKISKSIEIGVIPSQSNCDLANQEISKVIESLRETEEQGAREYVRERG